MIQNGAKTAVSECLIWMIVVQFDVFGLIIVVEGKIIFTRTFINTCDTKIKEEDLFLLQSFNFLVFDIVEPCPFGLSETFDGKFIVCGVLVDEGRFNKSRYFARSFWWEIDLLDDTWSNSRVALITSNIEREYVFNLVLTALCHKVNCTLYISWRSVCPLNWFWRWTILLCLSLFRSFLPLFALIIVIHVHQLTKFKTR
jgi:hypothetical protein